MYLHTSLQYKLLQFQSEISVKVGVLPFIWDPHAKKYKNNTKAFRFSVCTTICLYTFQYLLVFWNIFRHMYLHKNLPITGKLFYSSIWLIIFALQQLLLFSLYYRCDEFINLLNTLKLHNQHIAGILCPTNIP